MSEKIKNQSKNGNNKNQENKSDKNNNEDQNLIELDKKLSKFDEKPVLADYDTASDEDKEKLKLYANYDNLDEETKQTLKNQAKAADRHQENNLQQALYVKKQVQLLKTSIFLETVLKGIYLQNEVISSDDEIANQNAMSFCSSDWNMVKSIQKINEYKELIMSKIGIDMFKLFDNEEWVLLITRKDYV